MVTKYSIDDVVWVMYMNKAVSATVEEIKIVKKLVSYEETYQLVIDVNKKANMIGFLASLIFKSKKDLIESL